MTFIIGQQKVRARMERMAAENNVPQALIIAGPPGHGKLTMAAHLLAAMNSEVNGIIRPMIYDAVTVDHVRDIIEYSSVAVTPTAFILRHCDNLNTSAQNALLKVLEEPPADIYNILTISNTDKLLPTIWSRCQVITLQPYTKEDLLQISPDETLTSFCENPGQVKRLLGYDWHTDFSLANMVVEHLADVSAANLFNVSRRIAPENLDVFLNMLDYQYRQAEGNFTAEIRVLYQFKHLMRSSTVNKTNAFEMMLQEMRRTRLLCNLPSSKND